MGEGGRKKSEEGEQGGQGVVLVPLCFRRLHVGESFVRESSREKGDVTAPTFHATGEQEGGCGVSGAASV